MSEEQEIRFASIPVEELQTKYNNHGLSSGPTEIPDVD